MDEDASMMFSGDPLPAHGEEPFPDKPAPRQNDASWGRRTKIHPPGERIILPCGSYLKYKIALLERLNR
jgi:hypothetical protein